MVQKRRAATSPMPSGQPARKSSNATPASRRPETPASGARQRKFKVGDICITQNSTVPALNNGLVVVVLRVSPGPVGDPAVECPYTIQRVDGSRFPYVTSQTTGEPSWYRARTAECQEWKLRKPREDEFAEGMVRKAETHA